MKAVIILIVALASVSSTSALDYSPQAEGIQMCQELNGTMIYTQYGGDRENFHGLQHMFCKTKLGLEDSQSIFIDAQSGFNTRTIASTMLKHIGLINTTELLKGLPFSASNAAVLCPKILGSQATEYNLNIAFNDEEGGQIVPCVFADGSMVNAWSLIFGSLGIVLPDRSPSQTKLRREVIRDSMTFKMNIPGGDIFVKPRDAKTCSKNHDCKEFKVDPCTGKQLEESLVCHTGICVKPLAECRTTADCHGRAMVRGYDDDDTGYCLDQKCEDGYCIADYTDVLI